MVKVMVTGHTPKGDRCRLVGIELVAHAAKGLDAVRAVWIVEAAIGITHSFWSKYSIRQVP
jgi:hypothetical protein